MSPPWPGCRAVAADLVSSGLLPFLAKWFGPASWRFASSVRLEVSCSPDHALNAAVRPAGGVTSLHESTPGLLFHCVRLQVTLRCRMPDGQTQGGFFICTLYIVTMLFAWLAWLSAALLCVLLLSSAIYQHTRRHRGRGVWFGPVAEWEWYFPDESRPSVSARRATFAGALEAGLQTGAPAHDPKLGTISPLPPNPSDHTADDPFRRPTADFEKDDTKEDFSPSTHTATAA